ncbi:hypothetical protein Nepgr_018178 [Nepenthes gracilis]|uniref:histidine kinase n=1 Tax=Nepenthes gracilis TaxID=150966 RepID=A0AAD3STM4_NEPGR|nr:hypothetical protein Nepgr_018178 [Nepenthes gracilis]
MNGVLGMLQMLMDTDLDPNQLDYAKTAHASGKDLIYPINEVLDQAKIESRCLSLKLCLLISRRLYSNKVLSFSGKSHEKGIELAVYVSRQVPEIAIGDPGRFHQIITKDKGHIFVSVHLADEISNPPDMMDEVLRHSLNSSQTYPNADLLTQTKEHVQDIQSVLRRRCCGEFVTAVEVVKYVNTRKVAKKTIKKCMHDLNIMLPKRSSQTHKNVSNSSISALLRDVEAVTAEIFESLLSYMAGEKTKSKKSSRLMVSRPMHQSAASAREFEDVDAALDSLKAEKKQTGINIEQVDQLRRQMMKLESTIEDLDGPLECLFTHIVKARASLLNILSN